MKLPSPEEAASFIGRYATVRAALRAELGSRPLVLPDAKHFPDEFQPDERGARVLLRRMQKHAGMEDIPIRVQLDGAGLADPNACASGACAAPQPAGPISISDQGDEWSFTLAPGTLKAPTVATTLLAQALAAVFIEETRSERWSPAAPVPVTTEIVAIQLGFGVLLLQGAYMYSKSCGGPRVAQLSATPAPELALGVGLFALHSGARLRPARKLVETTQAALLAEASDWVAANADLAARLRSAPELLCDGLFLPKPPRPNPFAFLTRKRRSQPADDFEEFVGAVANHPKPTPSNGAPATGHATSARRAKPDDDLASLVAEALAES